MPPSSPPVCPVPRHLFRLVIIAFALLGGLTAQAAVPYDDHVIFDNAPADGPYAHSSTYVVAPSTFEQSQGKLPVTADRGLSPPNALRLHWKSAPGGDWSAAVQAPGRNWCKFAMAGDVLAFWCYSNTEITELNSPRVSLQDDAGLSSELLTLVRGDERLPAGGCA